MERCWKNSERESRKYQMVFRLSCECPATQRHIPAIGYGEPVGVDCVG